MKRLPPCQENLYLVVWQKAMDIVFLGHSSFRIKGKGASLITDPYDSEMVGFKFPSVEANIVTISHEHKDHNQAQLVGNVRKIVRGPGEYEILGISILGISSFHDSKKGEERGTNTIYVFEMEDLRLCHLGDLGHDLPEDILEAIGDIDILIVPVGGEYTIGPSVAVKIVQDIEPKIIIPMHYLMEGLNQEVFAKLLPLDSFLKEMGLPVERLPKLTIAKESLAEDAKVIVLEKR